MKQKIKRLDPAVDKHFLIAISGLLWIIVGMLLCRLSLGWLSGEPADRGIWITAGIALAIIIYRAGFLGLVNRNINRILSREGKVCIFAFQPWKSYVIVLVMIGMGTVLRHSQVPRTYLSVVYTGFGGAMILSSLRYLRVFMKHILSP